MPHNPRPSSNEACAPLSTPSLAGASSLERLVLAGCNIGPADLAHVALPRLRMLRVLRCPRMHDAGRAPLPRSWAPSQGRGSSMASVQMLDFDFDLHREDVVVSQQHRAGGG